MASGGRVGMMQWLSTALLTMGTLCAAVTAGATQRIAVIGPLTGDAAFQGAAMVDAARLAVEEAGVGSGAAER